MIITEVILPLPHVLSEVCLPLPHIIGEIVEDRLEPVRVQSSGVSQVIDVITVPQGVLVSVDLSGGISASEVERIAQSLIARDNTEHDDPTYEPQGRFPIRNLPPLP